MLDGLRLLAGLGAGQDQLLFMHAYRWLRRRHIGVERFLAAFGLRGAKVPPDSWLSAWD
jgi:hypothetical protein